VAQRDIELVRAAFERFNRRDLDGLLEFLDDEVEMTPAIVGPDLSESYRGKEEVMRFFGAITDAWASVTARENELVELADGRILAV
jgi:ketosteroid isomerase-like protein